MSEIDKAALKGEVSNPNFSMNNKQRAEAVANHRLSIANSLKHRMEVARATKMTAIC